MTSAKNLAPFLILAFALLAPSAHANATRAEAAHKLENLRQFVIDFQQAPDNAIPAELLADCYGVIIMRQFRAGFIFGGEYGEGVVLLHDRASGGWSPPAFIRNASGNWGFQAGGQVTDAIILIMNQEGVDMLLRSRFTIGVDASAAAGPVGRNFAAAVGPGTSLLTYARARGLFAGATLGGGAMFNNDPLNHALYGMPIGVRDIIEGRVQMPPEAIPLANTLTSFAMTYQANPSPFLPPPSTPGSGYNPAPDYDSGPIYSTPPEPGYNPGPVINVTPRPGYPEQLPPPPQQQLPPQQPFQPNFHPPGPEVTSWPPPIVLPTPPAPVGPPPQLPMPDPNAPPPVPGQYY